jgi:carbamoyltransferase
MHSNKRRTFLGINAAYHESAAALIVDDSVVFAVEEERLSRVKHAKQALVSNPNELPWRAIQACLNAAGLDSLADCDAIGYSLVPHRRIKTVGTDPYEIEPASGFGTMTGESEFDRRVQLVPKLLADFANVREITDRFHYIAHHRAHAASAF